MTSSRRWPSAAMPCASPLRTWKYALTCGHGEPDARSDSTGQIMLAGGREWGSDGRGGGVVAKDSHKHADGSLTRVGPGSRVAGYLVEDQIGAGGMAVVFRARDERLSRLVALKVLAPGLAADEGFRLRFIR